MTLSADSTDVLGDRYVLGELIGRGGMADVHRGTDTVLDRPVAVKMLRELTDDDADRARFVAEARTLARLNHAGLVTVLDAGAAGDRPYLVLELVDGPNLAECCSGTPLHLSRVVAIGVQVAEALAHAHAAGVVHRDVKPSNILLGEDGRAWLTDFGIARLLGDSDRHTRTGSTVGSPAYLAPEQVRGLEVTPAADVYSLGLVVIEMLTGRRAYPQAATEAALARLTVPPALPDRLPDGWVALLRRMTALEPSARPPAGDVAVELRRLAAGQDPEELTRSMAAWVAEQDAASSTSPATSPSTSSSAPSGSWGSAAARESSGPSSGSSPLSSFFSQHEEDEVGQEAGPDTRPDTRRGAGRGAGRGAAAVPRRRSRRTRFAAGAVAAGVALGATLVVLLDGGGEPAVGGDVPTGVPPAVEEPLGELHDAVHGRGR